MDAILDVLAAVNAVLWHDAVLYLVLAVGLVFTIGSLGSQYHSLTHGVAVVCGRHDSSGAAGALRPFQALSAALSATVGIGNIGGVALAITLGGPGAVFWMWVIGAVGMAIKTAEVSLAMLHRDVRDRERPRGGPMYVARDGLAARGWPRLGKALGGLFVVTLLIASVTGGNMFQAWNVAEISEQYFDLPRLGSGVLLAVVVGAVILGGIRRIGAVAGRLVPLMCGLYLLAAIVVLVARIEAVPSTLRDIVSAAFSATQAEGAFLGGSAGMAMLWGLKRALFSSEAGQGSSPIAHCAAKTDPPVREGVVAGLEPFIDTLVVCTLTALVILTSGIWNRDVDVAFATPPQVERTASGWTLTGGPLVAGQTLEPGDRVSAVVRVRPAGGSPALQMLPGVVGAERSIAWQSIDDVPSIEIVSPGVYVNYQGAALTARAFDQTFAGLGRWLVSVAVWLFALSTMISWSYYGEQGVLYLLGARWVVPYKIVYCSMAVVASVPGWITTDRELDALTTLGTGVMLWANVPVLVIFMGATLRAYRDYWRSGRHTSS